ncbi:cupredoxin domain-containing protein [Paenibacillus sp. YIM B09110]|uniref:cupredoxin domain-containing protein n=1 Tax=Paenibacillus sp. YIM B09110 TaxID=3126102 RepID=UPI00301E56F3
MSKVFIVRKKQIQLLIAFTALVVVVAVFLNWNGSRSVNGQPTQARVFQLVTTEIKSTTQDGQEIEVYRWDPGSIIVNKGEPIELHITGVSGKSHPFVIEGLGVRGTVTQGKTTVVSFTADKPGTYPIVCLTHSDMRHDGPMVGYITVQ